MAIFTTLTVPIFLTWTTNWLRKRGELIQQDARNGYLILGANPLGLYIAKHLNDQEEVTIIDSNRDFIQNAKNAGIKTVTGNILKDETMEEANAIDKNTFIAITSNSEINLLAAQFANDAFYFPNKIVSISPNEDGADVDFLEPIDASSMFATKKELEPWTHDISTGNFEERTEVIKEGVSTREWIKNHNNEKNILPILIINAEGKKRTFHYHESILPDEKVIYLQS
jgi:hypothetical protein